MHTYRARDHDLDGSSRSRADRQPAPHANLNWALDNHASGISLYRIDGGGASTNNLVTHNTIVRASNARWAINVRDGSTGNTLYNNILWNDHPWRGSISLNCVAAPTKLTVTK